MPKFVVYPAIVVTEKVSNRTHMVHETLGEGYRLPYKSADPLTQNTIHALDQACFPRLFFTAKCTSSGIAPL
jgi:hypothetical protein